MFQRLVSHGAPVLLLEPILHRSSTVLLTAQVSNCGDSYRGKRGVTQSKPPHVTAW